MGRTLIPLVQSLVVALAVSPHGGCGAGSGDDPPRLPHGAEHVTLDPADFVDRIDNKYWPMAPGTKWVFRERDDEGAAARIEVTVLPQTKTILGIPATVVHDVVTEDGEVKEDTYDWFAQDKWGNVWYLGEDTKEFENGKVKSTKGSWEAGVDGAEAGVVMPGMPMPGQAYRQEYYEGEAEDEGTILAVDMNVTVPFGSFEDVVVTKDSTPLDPGVVEHKFYAPTVGPVAALHVSGGTAREELVSFVRGRG